MDNQWTTTCFTLPGYRVARTLGVVRGVTVRSRGLGGQISASLRTIGGGRITEYVELCEQTRSEAFDFMVQHAEAMGANAIVGVRYDAERERWAVYNGDRANMPEGAAFNVTVSEQATTTGGDVRSSFDSSSARRTSRRPTGHA